MPSGALLKLETVFFIDSLLPVLSESESKPKVLVVHGTPSTLCYLPDLSSTNCTQLPVSSFSEESGVPYFLPFSDAEFDGIILQDVLDNSLDVSRTIFEMQRVLKPNGRFALNARNRNWASWLRYLLFQVVLRVEYPKQHNWKLFLKPSELERVVTAYGFESIQISSFTSSLNIFDFLGGTGVLNSISMSKHTDPNVYYCIKGVNKS